ncbi:hypothetical protein ACZ91_43350 [Streptomyces regensis]|nr:hypothetical protein ACZ91_43350 [Streptomyces regensis]
MAQQAPGPVGEFGGASDDRCTGRPGECGGTADLLEAAFVVVPAGQQVRGAASVPVTAPTIASLLSRALLHGFGESRVPDRAPRATGPPPAAVRAGPEARDGGAVHRHAPRVTGCRR